MGECVLLCRVITELIYLKLPVLLQAATHLRIKENDAWYLAIIFDVQCEDHYRPFMHLNTDLDAHQQWGQSL